MRENAVSGRKEYIDVAKGIGILLVLLGHLLPDDNNIKSMIYSFHMPLFFIVSGLVCKECKFRILFQKRAQRILVPYILWAVIFSGFSLKKLVFIAYGTNETLGRAESNAMLWFLASMFFASVAGTLIFNRSRQVKRPRAFLCTAVVILLALSYVLNFYHSSIVFKDGAIGLPWGLDISLLATAFFLTGKLMAENILPKINEWSFGYRMLLGVFCFLACVLGILEQTKKGYPQMATYDIGNAFFYFAAACVASFGLICLSAELKKGVISKLLCWFGRNSMLLFIMHRTFVYQCKNFYLAHPSWLVCMAMWVLLILYSSGTTMIINRFFPMLTGQTEYKNKTV